jgi:methionine aminopeptidase, type I (EC 3.4.11.18)
LKKFRGVFLKNPNEIALMRVANRITSQILDALGEAVRPGAECSEFEDICRRLCEEHQVRPAFLGYQGYGYALCCSVNSEVVHGFPTRDKVLREGDIVSFDMGVVYKGFYGDSARTFPVGQVRGEAARLMDVTRESLLLGIEQARPGNNLYDISAAVQRHAESAGFGVVRRFVGHGIGARMHEKPEVPNFVPRGILGLPLKAGMVLAIEPMITEGGHEVEVLADGWTAVTKDRKLAAHFEHTVAITPDGPQILSLSD